MLLLFFLLLPTKFLFKCELGEGYIIANVYIFNTRLICIRIDLSSGILFINRIKKVNIKRKLSKLKKPEIVVSPKIISDLKLRIFLQSHGEFNSYTFAILNGIMKLLPQQIKASIKTDNYISINLSIYTILPIFKIFLAIVANTKFKGKKKYE